MLILVPREVLNMRTLSFELLHLSSATSSPGAKKYMFGGLYQILGIEREVIF